MVRSDLYRARTPRLRRMPAYALWIIVFLVVIVVLLGCWIYKAKPKTPPIVLFIADPMIIASVSSDRKRTSVFSIPAETHITGLYGTGNYSLESLWKLGLLHNGNKNLLPVSLGEGIGVPIRHSVSLGHTSLVQLKDNVSLIPSLIGPTRWVDLATNTGDNTSLRDLYWIWWYFHSFDEANWKIINAKDNHVLALQTLPDGSQISAIDVDSFNSNFGNLFEDSTIRKEAISVAVYNTTGVPLVGTRISRTLEHIGVYIVSVGNLEHSIDDCEVAGAKQFLDTTTAWFIMTQYSCRKIEEYAPESAQLVLRVGTKYSDQFNIPY